MIAAATADRRKRPTATTWITTPTICGADRASRSQECHSRRPFHRRRRGGALYGTARREPGGKGSHYQRGAAADGEDTSQSEWPSQGRVRRSAGATRGQSLEILSRPAGGAVLRLQPAGREIVGISYRKLVAAGHDGRRQGALRRHRRLLANRFYRRPQEDHRAGAGDA